MSVCLSGGWGAVLVRLAPGWQWCWQTFVHGTVLVKEGCLAPVLHDARMVSDCPTRRMDHDLHRIRFCALK